ncbi:MAG: OmpA family protein [Flavobacteriales bacterium]
MQFHLDTSKKLVFQTLYLLLFAVFSNVAIAQSVKGDRYFDQKQYKLALEEYQKIIDKNPTATTIHRIASCYLWLKDYEKAEAYFEKATGKAELSNEKYLNYASILLNNNKLKESREQLQKYMTLNPNDERAKVLTTSLAKIEEWSRVQKPFKIESIEGINTKEPELCPQVYKKSLVFLSYSTVDWVNYDLFDPTREPYLQLYKADMKGDDFKSFGKTENFSKKLYHYYDIGPATFSNNYDTMYFCKSVKGKGYQVMQLFVATLVNDKIDKVYPFEHNSTAHSFIHPTLSPDGKKLFFASNMGGGKGGMDIYYSKKDKSGKWSFPKPVEGNINTPGNEVFPTFYRNKLYFSSDGHAGYGGLDIYMALEDDKFKNIINLREPLNSHKDDFGITFLLDDEGYISSNRTGGKGSDDIYYFKQIAAIEDLPESSITGVFEYARLGIANTTLVLMDEENNEIGRTRTNKDGTFEFRNLKLSYEYTIKALEDTDSDAQIFITNSKGQKVATMFSRNVGTFTFRPLPKEEYDKMKPLDIEEDELTFLTIPVYGQVYKKLPGDYAKMTEVYVVNEDGSIVARAQTNENGKFVFRKLAPNEQYLFKLSTNEEDLNIIILDENGKLVESTNKEPGQFKYIRLSGDAAVITLLNEEDVVIKIRENENFIISSIYYDYDKFYINEDAVKELNKLIVILNKNPHIGVILSSHTDSRASDNYNLELSQKRAKSAVDYMISKGISSPRLVAKGFGETKLVNHCANGVDCSEEEHAKNRRTEIQVISIE